MTLKLKSCNDNSLLRYTEIFSLYFQKLISRFWNLTSFLTKFSIFLNLGKKFKLNIFDMQLYFKYANFKKLEAVFLVDFMYILFHLIGYNYHYDPVTFMIILKCCLRILTFPETVLALMRSVSLISNEM